MFIKVCGFTAEADVDAALDLGVDAVGFVLAPSPRQLSLDRARALARRARGRALTVAVMVEPGAVEGFDAVQYHGPPGPSAPRIVEPGYDGDWYIVDPSRGRGVRADWQNLGQLPPNTILSGGLTPDTVATAIETCRAFGVDVSSGVESAPGLKDASRMEAFVDAARAAYAEISIAPI